MLHQFIILTIVYLRISLRAESADNVTTLVSKLEKSISKISSTSIE